MKIFVGWAYEETWIEDYVIPLIESYGIEVVTGKGLEGGKITASVRDRIKEASAGIFFTTRRGEPNAEGSWGTSDWVIDEIKHAASLEKEYIIEVREVGVDYSNKINEDREHIKMDPENRLEGLIALCRTVSRWKSLNVKVKLTPAQFSMSIRPRIQKEESYECSYKIRRQGRVVHGPVPAKIEIEGSELFVYAYDLSYEWFSLADTFLEISIAMSSDKWVSSNTRLSALEVVMTNLNESFDPRS